MRHEQREERQQEVRQDQQQRQQDQQRQTQDPGGGGPVLMDDARQYAVEAAEHLKYLLGTPGGRGSV